MDGIAQYFNALQPGIKENDSYESKLHIPVRRKSISGSSINLFGSVPELYIFFLNRCMMETQHVRVLGSKPFVDLKQSLIITHHCVHSGEGI